MAVRDDGFCAICGRDLLNGLIMGEMLPLLPGDIPTREQVCDQCWDGDDARAEIRALAARRDEYEVPADARLADLTGFVAEELVYLWGQLWDAYQAFINATWKGKPNLRWDEGGTWSGRCEGLGERIIQATQLVGPVGWRDVPMTALVAGWFDWANNRLQIADPDLPDYEDREYIRERVAELARAT